MSDLPLGGKRNFAYLARLSPGVVPAEPGARDAANGGFSANGVRSNGQNNFLLNGVDNNINTIDFLNQTAYAIGPSVEAVSEMSILTNGYNAEYGRAAGGVVNVTLKSRHEPASRQSVRDSAEQGPGRESLGKQPGGRAARTVHAEPVWRDGGRPDHQEQALHFRRLSGNAHRRFRRFGGEPGLFRVPHGPHRGDEERRFLERIGRRDRHRPNYRIVDQPGRDLRPAVDRVELERLSGFSARRSPATSFRRTNGPGVRQDPATLSESPTRRSRRELIRPMTITSSRPGKQVVDQGDGRVDYHISEKDSLFGSLSWSNAVEHRRHVFPGPLDGSPFNGAGETDLAATRR